MFTTPATRPVRGLPRYTTLVCFACILILLINGVSLLRNLEGLKAANALQARTARVSDELQRVNLLVTDAQSSLRGYFLSGSDSYLGPMRTATSQIDGQLNRLRLLLADSPAQLKYLAQLRMLVERELDLMNQSLEVYRKGGLADIVTIAASFDDRARMDEIRLQVVIMAGDQTELLAARSAAFYEQYRYAILLGMGINAAAIFVLVLFYRLTRSSFAARLAAQHALEDANDRLESTVALRTEQLSVLSRHLIRVSEEEKSRLARELHDEMGANLTAIGMDLTTVGEQLRSTHPELAAMLARARGTLVDTVELKRRIVEDLRPSLLDNLGLAAALQSYCEEYGRVTGLDCDALVEGDVDAAGPTQAIALFRITQEALNNVAKYARASSVIVHLAREDGMLSLEVIDDGVGIADDAASKPKSHGLLGMRERALLLGGSLKVERGVNGVGTCVSASIPLAPSAPGEGSLETPAVALPGAAGNLVAGAVPALPERPADTLSV
jgi:signal transduction histidine kinase